MSNLKTKFPFLLLLLVTAVSSAQTPAVAPAAAAAQPQVLAPPMSAATAAEIQGINENMTVLQARLNEMELRAKIAAKQKELNGMQGGSSFSALGSSQGDPSVIYVQGLKGHVEALLAFPGGVVQRVKPGDIVGDRKVARISLNEVALTDVNGKNERRLAFGTSAVARDTGTAAAGAPSPSGFPAPSPISAGIR
jgi:type IV pilus biogenesis protein PilP